MSKNLWNGCWRGNTPAGDTHQRARNVITPSGGIVRGKFPSRKNGRMVHHEGLLELDAIYHFETSPGIVRYREQPVTLNYPDGNRLRKYTPDFELVLQTGELVLIEVKPERNLIKEDVQYKLACVSEYLDRSQTKFVILTDKTLRQEPRLSNLRWLYHKTPRIPPSPDAMHISLARIKDQFPMSISETRALLEGGNSDVYSLLLSGFLRCPLEIEINPTTQLELTIGDDNEWFRLSPEHGF
jgi:hypothetical protein